MKSLLTDPIAAEEIPVRSLLGLGPRNQDIGNLRQLQLAPLRGRGSLRLLMGIGMAFVAAFTMVHSTPFAIAAGWLACALAFALWSFGKFNRLPLGDPKLSGMAEYRLCNRHALYSALLWGAPFWLQGLAPTLDHVLSMWTIAMYESRGTENRTFSRSPRR